MPIFPHPTSHDTMSTLDVLLKQQIGLVSKCMFDGGEEHHEEENAQCSVQTAIDRASLIIDLIAEITRRYPKQTLIAFSEHCTAWESMFKVQHFIICSRHSRHFLHTQLYPSSVFHYWMFFYLILHSH